MSACELGDPVEKRGRSVVGTRVIGSGEPLQDLCPSPIERAGWRYLVYPPPLSSDMCISSVSLVDPPAPWNGHKGEKRGGVKGYYVLTDPDRVNH